MTFSLDGFVEKALDIVAVFKGRPSVYAVGITMISLIALGIFSFAGVERWLINGAAGFALVSLGLATARELFSYEFVSLWNVIGRLVEIFRNRDQRADAKRPPLSGQRGEDDALADLPLPDLSPKVPTNDLLLPKPDAPSPS